MLSFVNKWWKMIVIGIMTILLIIAIVMIIDLKRINKDNMEGMKLLLERYDRNEIIYEKNKALLDSMETIIKEQKVIVINKNNTYETLKTTPIRSNISDAELLKRIRKFESDHNIK